MWELEMRSLIIILAYQVFFERQFSPYFGYMTVDSFNFFLLGICYPYSKQLILVDVKKANLHFVPSCMKHCLMLEEMINASVRFPMLKVSTMYDQINSSF